MVGATFSVTGEVERVGKGYRAIALRSVQDATDVLERAESAGQGTPFLFFACIQDAMSAVRMFAAAADHSVDDGYKDANLAAVSGVDLHEFGETDARSALEEEASETFQKLFDGTVGRVMAVFHEAIRQIKIGGSRAVIARKALEELDEVKRLVEVIGDGRIGLNEGLQAVELLEAAGRRAAKMIGTTY